MSFVPRTPIGLQGWRGVTATGVVLTLALGGATLGCKRRLPINAAEVHQGIEPADPAFPLSISENGRYLVSAEGKPWRLQSEFAWLLGVNASPAQMDMYLADRKAKGFNAFTMMNLVRPGGTYGWPTESVSGQQPFLAENDFSKPNNAYFDYVDVLIDKAAAQGFAVLMFYTYAGYGGGNEGWYQVVAQDQNTKEVCYQFGTYLAARWKNKPNLVLMAGGDYTMPAGETRDRMHEIHRGLRDGGCKQLAGSEWGDPDSLVTAQEGYTYGVQADLNLNSWYGQGPKGSGHVYETADRAWANKPVLPSYMEEPMQGYGKYAPPDSSRPSIRRYQHWAVLAGSTAGTNWGLFELANQFVDGQWQTQLNDVMAQDQAKSFALYDSIPWWQMRPSGTGTDYAGRDLIVSENKRDDSYISSSLTSDGSLLLAYVPPGGTAPRTFEVDLRALSGSARGRWWNPTSAAFTDITAGNYSLSNDLAKQAFSTPGDNGTGSNDWMLVLDTGAAPTSGDGGNAAGGTSGATGTGKGGAATAGKTSSGSGTSSTTTAGETASPSGNGGTNASLAASARSSDDSGCSLGNNGAERPLLGLPLGFALWALRLRRNRRARPSEHCAAASVASRKSLASPG